MAGIAETPVARASSGSATLAAAVSVPWRALGQGARGRRLRRWGAAAASLLHAAALLTGAAPAGAAEAPVIQGIAVTTRSDYTRVTVDLSGPAKPDVIRIEAEPAAGRPERVALDFAAADLAVAGPPRIEVNDGRISTIRFGRTRSGGVRIVLDLVRAARHRGLRHTHPPRIDLDVLGPVDPGQPGAR